MKLSNTEPWMLMNACDREGPKFQQNAGQFSFRRSIIPNTRMTPIKTTAAIQLRLLLNQG